MRKHGRTDGNQKEIVAYLRKHGFSVAITSSAGAGFPDLVVGRNGQNWLIEIKDPSKDLNQRKLTPAQQVFHGEWGGQIAVAETPEQAKELCK